MEAKNENKNFFTVGAILRSLEYKKQIENLEFKEKCYKLKLKCDPPGFEDVVCNDKCDEEVNFDIFEF